MGSPSPQNLAAGQKRSASDLRNDNEMLTASERESKRLRTEQCSRDPEQSDRSKSFQSQPKRVLPLVKRSLEDFPPITQPLPAKISITKLCRDFPNHLVGKTLRRFVESGWTHNMVYCSMDPAAQKSLAKENGLESGNAIQVMQTRFAEEKRRMAEEQEFSKSENQVETENTTAIATKYHTSSKRVSELSNPQRVARRPEGQHQDRSAWSATEFESHMLNPSVLSSVQHQEPDKHAERHVEHSVSLPAALQSSIHDGGHPLSYTNAHELGLRVDKGTEPSAFADDESRATRDNEQPVATVQLLTDKTDQELHNSIMFELRKHKRLICGPPGSVSSSEEGWRMLHVWGGRYQQWESSLIAAKHLSEKGISEAESTYCGLVRRQNYVLNKLARRQCPPPQQAQLDGPNCYWDIIRKYCLYQQAQILWQWSAEWEQSICAGSGQLQGLGGNKGIGHASQLDGASKNARDGPSPSEGCRIPQHYQRGTLHFSEAKGSERSGDRGRNDLAYGSVQRHQPGGLSMPQGLRYQHAPPSSKHSGAQSLLANTMEHNSNLQHAPQQSYQHGPRVAYGYMQQPRSQRTGLRHVCVLGQSNGALNLAGVSGRGSVESGPVPATISPQLHGIVGNAQPTLGVGHPHPTFQSGQGQPGTRKRGAPRKRMFPNARAADTALPPSALTNDDEVLRVYPEHLSNCDVMKRFVRGSIIKPGGYPTKAMVERLLHHTNAKDLPHRLSDEQRRKNLARWVTKEKDSCNAWLRSVGLPGASPVANAQQPAAQPNSQISRSSSVPATILSLVVPQAATAVSAIAPITTGLSQSLHRPPMQANAASAPPRATALHMAQPFASRASSIQCNHSLLVATLNAEPQSLQNSIVQPRDTAITGAINAANIQGVPSMNANNVSQSGVAHDGGGSADWQDTSFFDDLGADQEFSRNC